MSAPDIAIVVTAHREGLLLHPAFASARRARAAAEAGGLAVETVAVLDRADAATRDYLHEAAAAEAGEVRVFETDFGDVGLARNLAAARAGARYLALLDGDDLWCAEWLAAAHAAAQADPRRIVWHPEYAIVFGDYESVLDLPDMEDRSFRLLDLALTNQWGAPAFAERAIFLDSPYRPVGTPDRGFGHEDWTWNCDTIQRGAIHKIVPGTSHYLRRKGPLDSKGQRSFERGCLPIPSDLFRKDIARAAGG